MILTMNLGGFFFHAKFFIRGELRNSRRVIDTHSFYVRLRTLPSSAAIPQSSLLTIRISV